MWHKDKAHADAPALSVLHPTARRLPSASTMAGADASSSPIAAGGMKCNKCWMQLGENDDRVVTTCSHLFCYSCEERAVDRPCHAAPVPPDVLALPSRQPPRTGASLLTAYVACYKVLREGVRRVERAAPMPCGGHSSLPIQQPHRATSPCWRRVE